MWKIVFIEDILTCQSGDTFEVDAIMIFMERVHLNT